jgi:hypothetical protein
MACPQEINLVAWQGYANGMKEGDDGKGNCSAVQ